MDGDDAVAINKGAAWSAHFLSDMTVPFHVIGASDSFIRSYFKKYENNKDAVQLTDIIKGESKLVAYAAEMPTDFREIVNKYFEANKEDSTVNYFDAWYWNAKSTPSSSHLWWETQEVSDQDTPTGFTYDAGWKNAKLTSFEKPWEMQKDMIIDYAKRLAIETRKKLEARLKTASSGRNEAMNAIYTLWRASVSALIPSLEAMPTREADGTLKIILQGRVESVATETSTDVKVRLVVEGGVVQEGSTGVIQLDPIKASEVRSSDEMRWVILINDIDKFKAKIETVGLFTQTPDLQYNNFIYKFKAAKDVDHGVTSFKYFYDILLNDGSGDSDRTTNFGDGSTVSLDRLSAGTYGVHGEVGTQIIDVKMSLYGDGLEIQNMNLNNTAKDDLGNAKVNTNVYVNVEKLPLKYSMHLGGGIYLYAFWAKGVDLKKYTTSTDYTGEGTYQEPNPDGSGELIDHPFTLKTKAVKWENSIMYVEMINKSNAEIQKLVSDKKVTQEELNRNVANWVKIINQTLGD
jgi:hypothetical protein